MDKQNPFNGIKVVECGEGISAAFGTKLLADLGAEVIKIEPLEGDLTRRRGPFPQNQADPEKSGIFIYLNTNKRGVAADLRTAEGQKILHSLLKDADVLIHNIAPADRAQYGLDPKALNAAYPQLIATSISMFGDYGPHANYKAYEMNAAHASGWAFLSPGASPYPELPPLKCFGSQLDFQGGAHAAIASLGAYIFRLQSGKGQAVDISEQECVAAMLEQNFVHYTYAGAQASRLGQRLIGPWFIADCADGKIFVFTVEEDQWKRLVEFMGNPEWANDELFADRLSRGRNNDALKALMADWLSEWKVLDLYKEAQRRRIPFATINTMQHLYESEHLRERKFFVQHEQPGVGTLVLPGMPSRYSKNQWSIRRPAPRLGEHFAEIARGEAWSRAAVDQKSGPFLPTAGKQPLSGIRVLDFTWVWAGPYCTLQLAHMGAEVIRVETTKRLCPSRLVGPFPDGKSGINRAGYFNQYNQGKKSVALDLSRPEGIEITCELVKHADIVTDNFAAGVMERLGLGYERLRSIKPDIIQISMSAFGQSGPFKGFIGYGPPAAALSGLFFGTGYTDGDPCEIGISYPDPNAGVFGAFAVMAALTHRAKTGEGQFIDQSQWETVLVEVAEGLLEYSMTGKEPARKGNHDSLMAPHDCYKAAGDSEQWVSIAVGTEAEWRSLCQAMGQPGLANDQRFASAELRKRNEAELDAIITGWTSQRDRWESTRLLQSAGVAAFPSMSNKDLTDDPHLKERGYLVQLEHPEVGRRIHAGIPWKMSASPCSVSKVGPLLGQDTEAVLASLLKLSPEQIQELRRREITV
ncbi:MAG TPA: CoA transferase [Candidatus Binataceae bacterium]|nr:CoA transferase [Candidatus Binataceae bacterium]